MKGQKEMIDSLSIKLNTGQFLVSENNKFDGRKTRQGKGYTSNTAYLEEYRNDLEKQGIYCPVISWAKKITSRQEPYEGLEIQTSVPKTINGTNLYDTLPEDIDKLCNKLLAFLSDIGVNTTESNLRQAAIKQVDFAKVIRLPDYLGRADEFIYKLSLFNRRPQSEFIYRQGINGSFMRFGNTTRHYTIYDKFGEILDKGFTREEKRIIQALKDGELKRNALKFELSLHRNSVGAVLRRRIKGKEKDFTLEDIFNIDLAKDILLDAFDEVFNNTFMGLITFSDMQDNELWAYLDNSSLSMKRQESLYYWVRMATKIGAAGAWAHISQKYSGGSVDRKRKEIGLSLAEMGEIKGNMPNLIGFLRQELNKFEIIKPLSTSAVVKHC